MKKRIVSDLDLLRVLYYYMNFLFPIILKTPLNEKINKYHPAFLYPSYF